MEKRMKIFTSCTVLLLFIVAGAGAITSGDFSNPPSNMNPMQVYIKSVYIDDEGFSETNLVAGDKIGAFDVIDGDTLCVGFKELTSSYTSSGSDPLLGFNTYEIEKEYGVVVNAGYQPGNNIIMAVYKPNDDKVYVFNQEELIFVDPSTGEQDGEYDSTYVSQGTVMIEIFGGGNVPVELASFSVTSLRQGKGAMLTWQTSSETNNYGFKVERAFSSAQNGWETIGFVEGEGTSHKVHSYSFVDNTISQPGRYLYRLKQIDTDGSYEYSSVQEWVAKAPSTFALSPNFPNPFNPQTTISYQVKEKSLVTITVYDLLGQEVATLVDAEKQAGSHTVTFNATEMSAGTYFYKMKAGQFEQIRKMTLVK